MIESSSPSDSNYASIGLCSEYHLLVGETLEVRPTIPLHCEHAAGSWEENVFTLSPVDHGRHAVVFTDDARTYPVEIWVYLDYGKMVKRGCVLPPSRTGWDQGVTSDCSVFEEDGTFYMFYTGSPSDLGSAHPDQGIGLAVSTDLFHW
ncbi:MAG: hypothetical protein V1800_18055, partial [Candidatus Latescibacterota bacterium]